MKTKVKFLDPLLLISVLIMTFSSVSASNKDKKQQENKTVYSHYLVFWLNPDLTDQQVVEFTNFFEGLKKLPYQKHLRYGKPAASTPRTVLDQTYTYNAVMEFDSLEDLEAYGKLSEHLSLVERYKKYFTKMLVYDTLYENN